ncbi:hypothetical protein CB1_001144031 [Camelus ferus]|nr:hypothetical protein CB1_001144031 [Camelus ferus]
MGARSVERLQETGRGVSRELGGEKAQFVAEGHVWPAGTWTSRPSRFREAAGEVPRLLSAPQRVPARGAPESRSDESAGQEVIKLLDLEHIIQLVFASSPGFMWNDPLLFAGSGS